MVPGNRGLETLRGITVDANCLVDRKSGRTELAGFFGEDFWVLPVAFRKSYRMGDIQFDNVESILSYFEDLKDPRSHINRLHIFGDLIVICIMAVIAGADGHELIGTWADSNHTQLKKHLQLPHGIPSHDTLGRLHRAALKPIAFQACFQASIQTVAPLNNDGAMNQIAIDGKVLRVSHDRSKGLGSLWLVSIVRKIIVVFRSAKVAWLNSFAERKTTI